jgi:hypothetical protein
VHGGTNAPYVFVHLEGKLGTCFPRSPLTPLPQFEHPLDPASPFLGLHQVHGGINAPDVFVDLDGKSSWDMFSKILSPATLHPFSSPTLTRAIAHPLFSLQVHGGISAPYVFFGYNMF